MEKEMCLDKISEFSVEEMEKLKGINIKLTSIVPVESAKIQIELLYFDLLYLLRTCNSSSKSESSIIKLKYLHDVMDNRINHKRRTVRNSVSAIRTFRNSIRIVLRQIIKNPS